MAHLFAVAEKAGSAPRLPRWASYLLRCALLLIAASMVTFALVAASPVDPVRNSVGQAAYGRMSEVKREQLAERWGTDKTLPEHYIAWANGAVRGDLGESLRYNRPVTTVIAERAGNTLMLMASAWVLSGAMGLALGLAAGMRRGSAVDRAIRGYCMLIASTPAFWLGLAALMVFSVWLGWFPLGFSVPIGTDPATASLATRIYHAVLPALVLSVTGVANVALHTREKVIDVMASDYARFAAARGASRAQVLARHGLRNLLLPAITLQFAQVSEIFGGSVLVEQVFSYPGLGQAATEAGVGGDAPLLVGIALTSVLIVAAGNAVAEVLYGVVDPRLRARGRAGRRARSEMRDLHAEEPGMTPSGSPYAYLNHAAASQDASEFGNTPVRDLALELHAPRRVRGGNRRRMLGTIIACGAILLAVGVAGHALEPTALITDFSATSLAPNLAHPFGTDWMGRDMLARTLAGLSRSLTVGLISAAISSVIAFVLAAVAALGGRRADAFVTWVIDLVQGMPHIVLLIVISYAFGRGELGVTVAVATTHWTSLARVLRAEMLQLREQPFMQVSRAFGQTPWRIALIHAVPAVLPQYLTGLILLFPHAILHEASITFLGFGLSADLPAVGVILSEAMTYLSAGMWWLAVLPGAALVACVLLFSRAGSLVRALMTPQEVQA